MESRKNYERWPRHERHGFMEPVKEDYDERWERGLEYLMQEGISALQKMRESAGLTRDQVYELCDHQALHPARQELIEDAIGWPELDEWVWYARIFGFKPGELMDAVFEAKGAELMEDEEEDAVAS
jgi:hypothetical protein